MGVRLSQRSRGLPLRLLSPKGHVGVAWGVHITFLVPPCASEAGRAVAKSKCAPHLASPLASILLQLFFSTLHNH